MSDIKNSCNNCASWQQYPDIAAGHCKERNIDCAAGFWCQLWSDKQKPRNPGKTRKQQFDVEAGAKRACAELDNVNTVDVQRLLRCTFHNAALVVEYLKGKGLIG